MIKEQTPKLSDDERRLTLAAMRILTQLNNRRKPDEEDVQLLKKYLLRTGDAEEFLDIASEIIRLESTVKRYLM